MKIFIVPSSAFVPGKLMQPLWIERDLEAAIRAKLAAEARIAAFDVKIANNTERLKGFKQFNKE